MRNIEQHKNKSKIIFIHRNLLLTNKACKVQNNVVFLPSVLLHLNICDDLLQRKPLLRTYTNLYFSLLSYYCFINAHLPTIGMKLSVSTGFNSVARSIFYYKKPIKNKIFDNYLVLVFEKIMHKYQFKYTNKFLIQYKNV